MLFMGGYICRVPPLLMGVQSWNFSLQTLSAFSRSGLMVASLMRDCFAKRVTGTFCWSTEAERSKFTGLLLTSAASSSAKRIARVEDVL